jgi:hypothetical protein
MPVPVVLLDAIVDDGLGDHWYMSDPGFIYN